MLDGCGFVETIESANELSCGELCTWVRFLGAIVLSNKLKRD